MPPSHRIAYVLKRYPRFSETFVVNEILAHEAAGFELDIFALRPPADSRFQPDIARVKAEVSYLRSGSIRAGQLWQQLTPFLECRNEAVFELGAALDTNGEEVCQALELAQAVQRRGITHLHAHFGTSATTVARMASLLTGVPYTFTAHAKDIFHEYVDANALEQKIADAARVVTVSQFNVDHVAAAYPEHADKMVRIYNGLPLERYPLRTDAPREPLVLAVGRLVEKKGFDDLITACGTLRDRGIGFRCEIVGGGDLHETLERQIDRLELGARVQLTGSLPLDQVAERMRRAAVLAAPCITASTGDRDGLPTVLLEAMATGTPCVATDVTGIPEVIRDGETGILLPERQPSLLADALATVLAAPSLGRKFALAARQLIEQSFDVQRNAQQLRQVFSEAVVQPASLFAEAV